MAESRSAQHKRYLARITVIATLGGLLFGYDTGVISGALLYMRQDLQLTSLGEATVVSSLLFGAAFGALLGGKLADALGRRAGTSPGTGAVPPDAAVAVVGGRPSLMEAEDVAGNSAETGRSVTSKVIAILMTFTDGSTHSLTEIARLAVLPISTAHRLATELAARGALDRTEDGNYRVGLPLRMIGTRASTPPNIQERAPRVMEDLSTATRATVRLGVLDDLEVAHIEKAPGHRPVTMFGAAATLPAHATALGKALLAFTSPRVVDLVIAEGLRAYTPYTLTTPDRFRRALAVTRLTRIAVSRWELELGVSTVATPVFAPGGHVMAALELRVRDLRSDLQVVQPALIVAARSLSRELVATGGVESSGMGAEQRPDRHLPRSHLRGSRWPRDVDLP